jgi:hypothetical protein
MKLFQNLHLSRSKLYSNRLNTSQSTLKTVLYNFETTRLSNIVFQGISYRLWRFCPSQSEALLSKIGCRKVEKFNHIIKNKIGGMTVVVFR